MYDFYREKYEIDRDFVFNGFDVRFIGDGEIICKGGTYLGMNSRISCNKGYKVEIGHNCAISHNIRIYTNTYDANTDFNLKPRKKKYGDVTIGNGVWVGLNVVILPGITIGDNSVIGANSVVTRDIPANCISGGIPCRIIKEKSY